MDYGFNDNKSKVDIFDAIYPVGSIYMSVNSTNPAALFGGTWEAWGSGRVPVGVDTEQTEFDTVEETGGEKKHQLSIFEMPSHSHSIGSEDEFFMTITNASTLPTLHNGTTDSLSGTTRIYPFLDEPYRFNKISRTDNYGSSSAHNNLQPYITCYMWKRTA